MGGQYKERGRGTATRAACQGAGDTLAWDLMDEPDLAALWKRSEPLPGGRGTARSCSFEGRKAVVKKESRGGLSRRFLPDRFLFEGPFGREWALAERLHSLGLVPRHICRAFVRSGGFFEVYVLVEHAEGARSLADLWQDSRLDAAALRSAGSGVGRLHSAGVLHGDLNGGNVLIAPEGEPLFLDLRHSILGAPPPSPARRRRNLLRLARSLHKIRATRGLAWPEGIWSALAAGYADGWGEREAWLDGWAARCERGFRFRSLLWRRAR